MKGNRQNIKFAKAIGPGSLAFLVKSPSSSLGLDDPHVVRQKPVTFLGTHGAMVTEPLHFDLNLHSPDVVLKQAVECMISWRRDVFPAFQSSDDVHREGGFSDYAANAT